MGRCCSFVAACHESDKYRTWFRSSRTHNGLFILQVWMNFVFFFLENNFQTRSCRVLRLLVPHFNTSLLFFLTTRKEVDNNNNRKREASRDWIQISSFVTLVWRNETFFKIIYVTCLHLPYSVVSTVFFLHYLSGALWSVDEEVSKAAQSKFLTVVAHFGSTAAQHHLVFVCQISIIVNGNWWWLWAVFIDGVFFSSVYSIAASRR